VKSTYALKKACVAGFTKKISLLEVFIQFLNIVFINTLNSLGGKGVIETEKLPVRMSRSFVPRVLKNVILLYRY
jgi:hypothetical protein